MLAPTRELAIQITSVLTELCQVFKGTQRRVEVVNVVGGMSEHKQRRQLDDTKGRGRPVHIMVSTPYSRLLLLRAMILRYDMI